MRVVIIALLAASSGCAQLQVYECPKGTICVDKSDYRKLPGLPVVTPSQNSTHAQVVYLNMRRTPFGKDGMRVEVDKKNGEVLLIDVGTETSDSPLGGLSELLPIILPIALGTTL